MQGQYDAQLKPSDRADYAGKAHLKDMVPTKRVAESAETAHLALYLASPECSHMVGQVLPLAGGWTTTTG